MAEEYFNVDSIEDYTSDIESINVDFSKLVGNQILLNAEDKVIQNKHYLVKGKDLFDFSRLGPGTSRLSEEGLIANKTRIYNSEYILLRVNAKAYHAFNAHLYIPAIIGMNNKITQPVLFRFDRDGNLPFYEIDNVIGTKIKSFFESSAIATVKLKNQTHAEYNRFIDLYDVEYTDILSKHSELLDLFYEGDWSFDKVSNIIKANCEVPSTAISDKAKYALTIRFPEITIKNSKSAITGSSHEIKDLFVTAYFSNEMMMLRGLYGRRMSITAAEYDAKDYGYAHSHLPRNRSQQYHLFCLGSPGNPIKDAVDDMCCNPLTNTMLEKFLLHLSFVRYESLEGTPHCYFKDVLPMGKKPYFLDTHDVNIEVDKIISKIDFKVPFVINNATEFLTIKVDDNNVGFNTYLDILASPTLKCIVDNDKAFIKSDYTVDTAGIKEAMSKYKPLYFKNNIIKAKLIETELSDNVVEGMYPKAKKEIYNRLANRANSILLNKNYYESRTRKAS